jgi:hypothetical protein
MKHIVLVAACATTAACGSAGPQLAKAPGSGLHPAAVEGFPELHCRAESSRTRHPLCDRTAFTVRALVIPAESGPGGLPAFCIAYMPYNKLTVHTGNGMSTTITWKLDPGSSYGFDGAGIAPIKGSENDLDDLFEAAPTPLPTPTPTPMPTLKKETKRTVKPGAPVNKAVHHLPLVHHWDGTRLVPCVGVDPIIINNAG